MSDERVTHPITWGDHIHSHRVRKGKSMLEVSREVGISQSELSLIERDKVTPRLDMVVWLAVYFGVTVDELIGHSRPSEGGETYV